MFPNHYEGKGRGKAEKAYKCLRLENWRRTQKQLAGISAHCVHFLEL